MKQSELFTKTSKTTPSDDVSVNAKLLEQGGFIYKNSAGVYTFLPLGWRVIQKISAIIREEMNAIGGQEMFMPALHDKRYLKTTGRWDVDVVFKVISGKNNEPNYNISWTHEEIITEIATRYINSYKDLPFSIYQIQSKFRNEPRAKSGLLRGREFIMKDLYSFHESEEDLMEFYERTKVAYHKIFKRCGLRAFCTLAAGGDFTANNTHEFQVVTPVGEDTIFVCMNCGYAENKEISKLKNGDSCKKCKSQVTEQKAVEVGNIFPLGTKYSKAFNLQFANKQGKKEFVVMGSYGIGLGRLMGTVAELYNAQTGMRWPESIAPFAAHVLNLDVKDKDLSNDSQELCSALQKSGVEILYDDRDVSPGVKFADADLIGIPQRIVVSKKTRLKNSYELKSRDSEKIEYLKLQDVINKLVKK